jgi:MinD-like ATPase involved in chromosome partitioning or flagellar assembly
VAQVRPFALGSLGRDSPGRHGAGPVALPRSQQRLTSAVHPAVDDRLSARAPEVDMAGLGERQLEERAGTPVRRPTVVAVTGVGGGAGRTTVTAMLGATLATVRRQPVVAVDASAQPVGMLASRLERTTSATVHELRAGVRRMGGRGAAACLNVDPSGLLVLAGGRPAAARLLDSATLAAAVGALTAWYPLLLLDLPPAPGDAAWSWVQNRAAVVVFVVRAAAPDLTLLAETLPVLERAGMAAPGGRTVVVINQSVPGQLPREARLAAQLVAARVRSTVRLRFDGRLADGQRIRLSRLSRRSRNCALRLAAECGQRFR